jgi:oxygen-independent coproporphyrinogen-3 oxidase
MDDDILNEFHRIKQIVMDAGYQRYEISNFGKRGAGSIHNGVYRQMEEYLGL